MAKDIDALLIRQSIEKQFPSYCAKDSKTDYYFFEFKTLSEKEVLHVILVAPDNTSKDQA